MADHFGTFLTTLRETDAAAARDAELILARSHLWRAVGLAQSLEHPLEGAVVSPGARAVASEIVQLISAALAALHSGDADSHPRGDE